MLNLRVMSCCAASVEGGLHQHGRTSPRRMGMSTSQASRGSWPFLLVVIQPSSQCPRSSCCPIQASGAAVPRAWPPSRTRPVCTARPSSASRRASSSGLATDSSPAGLPHCAAETLGGSSNFQTRALKIIHVARLSLFARTRAWL